MALKNLEQGDALDWTIPQALQAIAKDALSPDDKQPTEFIGICLWNEGDNYATKLYNVGLSLFEIISLLEIQKSRMLVLMHKHYAEDFDRD